MKTHIWMGLLAALLAGCELGGARAEEKRAVAPAVLFVEQPPADAAAAGFAPILAKPSAPPDGSEARPFPTLRAALAAAPAGALLRIGPGLWRERLSITRPVVLLGSGPGRTRISAEGGLPEIEVRGTDHVELRGLSVEGGGFGVSVVGGVGHRLEDVDLRDSWQGGLRARGAQLALANVRVEDVGKGRLGTGIDLDGGSLEATRMALRAAGRRGIILHSAAAVLTDVTVEGSALSAVQATDGAEVRVVRGRYTGQGGASLYAGGARLSIEGSEVGSNEFAVIGFRGAEVNVTGAHLSGYRVAGIGLVTSGGTIQRTEIDGFGSEAAVSVTGRVKTPVLLVDNRISRPGPMGVHVTESSLVARGNIITGSRPDPQGDMGDAFYAVSSELRLEKNTLRGNAGSGVVGVRSKLTVNGNDLLQNGRSGLLLLDGSKATATGNYIAQNASAGVELSEQAKVSLSGNRFRQNTKFDVDASCEQGLRGTADISSDNSANGPLRERVCTE